MFRAESQLQLVPHTHTHLSVSAHYTCGQKHTMWHSLNGMATFKNIWHDSGFNMSL